MKAAICYEIGKNPLAIEEITLDKLLEVMGPRPVIVDVRGFLDGPGMRDLGVIYRCL